MTNPPPHPDGPFPRWLRRQLAERHWSHQDLAERVGVAPTTVSWWVNGRSTPQWDAVQRLATALGKDFGEAVHEILLEPTADSGG